MGGDDLGSDDEEWMAKVATPIKDRDDISDNIQAPPTENEESRKRKTENDDSDGQANPKRNKHESAENLLVESGRNIQKQPLEAQAVFLTTAVKHYCLVAKGSTPMSQHFSLTPKDFYHSNKDNIAECVTDVLSLKKLKKWKQVKSPCVVIICMSARRSVEVVKQFSFLKTRIAKLFPKNASPEEQRQQLQSTPFGLAVGTPSRLSVLAGCSDENVAEGLNFDRTHLVVLDSFLSNKMYSVVSAVLYNSVDCFRNDKSNSPYAVVVRQLCLIQPRTVCLCSKRRYSRSFGKDKTYA